MKQRRKSPILALQARYEESCTATGKPLVLVAVVAGSLGLVSLSVEMPVPFVSLILLAFLGGVWGEGWLHRPRRTTMQRALAGPLTAGVTAGTAWTLTLQNTGRGYLYDLEVQENLTTPWGTQLPASASLACLEPRTAVNLNLAFQPPRRGVYRFAQTWVWSHFPFHLFRWKHRLQESGQIVVYPEYRHLEELDLKFGRRYQPGGILVSSNIGDSAEFMGVRPFMPGDNPRHIHWPSLAKTGSVAVKEFHEEYFSRLGLIIDGETSARDSDPAFEAAVSLTASIADWIARKDYILDVFVAGDQMYHFQAGRALAHLDNVLEILACLEPAPAVALDSLALALEPELPRLSAVICVFLKWDAAREAFVQNLLNRGLGLKILLLQPADLPAELLPLATTLNASDWKHIRL